MSPALALLTRRVFPNPLALLSRVLLAVVTCTGLVAASALAAPLCSKDGWCWENPLPLADSWRGMVPRPDARAWLVSSGGLLVEYDGREWRLLEEFDPSWARALVGRSPDEVWLLGRDGRVFRWDGARWSKLPATGLSHVSTGWAPAPGELWVSGREGVALWDGSRWQRVKLGTDVPLLLMAGRSRQEVWFGGEGDNVWRWDGKALSGPERVSGLGNIKALQVGTAEDLWAAGEKGIARRVGGQWRVELRTRRPVEALLVRKSGELWAADNAGTVHVRSGERWQSLAPLRSLIPTAMIESSDGEVWISGFWGQLVRCENRRCQAVRKGVRDDLKVIIGTAGVVYAGGNGLHLRDSSGWRRVPDAPYVGSSLGIGPGGLWVAGPNGRTFRPTGPGRWEELYLLPDEESDCPSSDGLFTHCEPEDTPDSHIEVRTFWTGPKGEFWALASSIYFSPSSLFRWTGKEWKRVRRLEGAPLRARGGIPGGGAWFVGLQGHILRLEAGQWTETASGHSGALNDVCATGPKAAWAVGDGGAILHWNGSAWSAQPSGTSHDLLALWCHAPDAVFAAGQDGTLLRYDGVRWRPERSGTDSSLEDLWGDGAGKLWVVGRGGAILRRTLGPSPKPKPK